MSKREAERGGSGEAEERGERDKPDIKQMKIVNERVTKEERTSRGK